MERRNGKFIDKKIRIAALDGRTCFPAGTKVKTPSGYKNIEDIKVGDSVISHKGIKQTVTETMERDYSGGMSEIKVGNKELYCTEDHPVLIRRGGHDYWEVAKNIIPGDKVFVFTNKGIDNLDHISGNLPVEWCVRNANNEIPVFVKPFNLSGVSGRSLLMPINSVNFKSNISLWKEKINGISIYFGFLFKRLIKFFKTNSNVLFWFCFACILMIAGWAAKFSTFVNLRRAYSELFTTISASQVLRRSSAFLRTIVPVFAGFYIKHFPASFAGNIFTPEMFIFTFYGTVVISICIGFWNTKLFTATNTDFMSASSGKLTFFRAINKLRAFFYFAWSKIKFFTTDNTGKVFPIALLPFGITRLGTAHIAGFRLDLGYENFKLFSANPTSFNNSFTTHIVTSSNISNLNYNIKVYNLEVENDKSYIANGIVVHNCPACIALHGTEMKVGEPVKDHFNGRCDAIYVPAGGEMPEFMQAMSKPGERNFVPFQDGTSWFDAQSDAYKKQVLGPGRFELYQQGKFKLDESFVNWHDNDVFGSMPGAKPLWQLEGFDSYLESYLGISKKGIEEGVIEFDKNDYKNLWYHRDKNTDNILSSGYLKASDDNWAPDIYRGSGYGDEPIIIFGVDEYKLQDFRFTMTTQVASNTENLDLYDMRLIVFDPVTQKRFFVEDLFYGDELKTEAKLKKAIELLLGR
jgi:hypothetical protein